VDGLAQAFQGFFSNPGDLKLLQTGIAGAGEAGNILQQVKANQYRDFVMGLLNNPGRLATMTNQLAAPLSGALTQSVENQVQGNVASRGLGQAPGIFAANESQALAPYVQQNQNTALQSIMQALGVPAGTFGQQSNLSPLFTSLFSQTPKMIPGQNTTPAPGLTPPPVSTGGSGTIDPSGSGDYGM
jgi:hypothetical protein